MPTNTQQSRGSARKNKSSNLLLIIAKAFFISSCIFALVVMGGAFIIRNYTIIPPPVPPAISSTATPASIVVEPHADDLGIGHGLRAPLGFTDEDRKELFYTFLIMGLDDGINVDTIMVASYDGIENVASIVSIPRDTLVNVSRRHRKINVAYPAGRIHGGSAEAGIRQLKRELRSIIGFEPDFYIKIDFDAFVRIIDSVGGVDIDVPIHMRYEDPLQGLRIDIPAGMQRLNGEQTLQFARFRLANPGFRTISDFERVQNQQAVVQAMLSSLITPTSLLRIPEFISIFQENVSTNITASEMLWFASQLPDIHSSRALSTYTLPIARNSGPPNWYEFADIPATLQLVNSTINPFTMPITENDVDIAQQ